MKKALLLPLFLFLLLTACKDEDDPEPVTKVVVDTKKQEKSPDGKITTVSASAIVHIWNAENADFDVEASGSDVYIGYIYDKNTDDYVTADYGSVGAHMNEIIEPGKYFVYVLLMKSAGSSSLAYSYKYFEVKEGETATLKKVFSHNAPAGAFEEWDRNK